MRATFGVTLTAQIQSLEGVINDLGARAHARSGAGAGDAEAAGRREDARRRRQRNVPRERRDCRDCDGGALVAGRHLRRAARSAAGSRKPAALRAPRRRAARSAGRRDAVDLAGARLAHRHLRRPQRSVHRRAGVTIRASTSRPTRASRSIATADGTVESASYTGDYGNLIVHQARLRADDALRPPERVRRQAGPDRQARRRHRLRRLDRPLDRLAPALRNPRQRQADQPAAAPHAAREPLTARLACPAEADLVTRAANACYNHWIPLPGHP